MMSFTNSLLVLASAIYNCGASLIRYWYVKSSLKPHIQEDFKKDKFLHICKFFPQVF